MKIDITVPQAGESVTEAMIGSWFKQNGEQVQKDEPLVELETDKSNLEMTAEESGVLVIAAEEGAVVKVGQVIGHIEVGAESKTPAGEPQPMPKEPERVEAPAPAPLSPAVRKMVEENKLDPSQIEGTGKGGRLTKGDVLQVLEADSPVEASAPATPVAPKPVESRVPAKVEQVSTGDGRSTRSVPMSMLRRRIAQRLVEAQQNAAILTTFNEVDMSAVMAMRKRYQEAFQKKYGIKLGFMSFFVRACVEALKLIPEINAQLQDQTIVYHNYCDVGVAVGSDRGLVVPVIRNAERMGFADIEKTIGEFGQRAKEGKLTLDELTGGTFTISNGGIYGSLLSTPILNPPQSGILGMHKIEKRPVVVEGDQIAVRPMMYLALSYDHRIVDGKEAVTFLVHVKDALEDPARMLLEL